MSDRRIARRTILGGLVGAAFVPSFPAIARLDGPPVLRTARHQFTILYPPRIVEPLPLTRVNGSATTFASFRGKVMLVNFWATWCAACRTELPILDALQESLGRKIFEVVAISVDRGGRTAVAPFLQDLKLRHLGIYLDPDGRVGRADSDGSSTVAFQLYGMPISYIVGPSGRIEGYIAGEVDWLSEEAGNLLNYYLAAEAG